MPDFDTATALTLASSLCARLCHDIAGPLGALDTTLEALAEDGEGEMLTLATQAAAELTARLRLLRAAWGGEGEALDAAGIASLAVGLPRAETLHVELGAWPSDLPAEEARLALNLLLVAASCLPYGGSIVMDHASGCRLCITGRRAAWPEDLAECAASQAACWAAACAPRNLSVPLACLLAASLGMVLHLAAETEPACLLLTARHG